VNIPDGEGQYYAEDAGGYQQNPEGYEMYQDGGEEGQDVEDPYYNEYDVDQVEQN